jgi:hypothetical protein
MDSSDSCPFCGAPLEEGAVLCRHCGRDVAFVVIRALTRRLAGLEQTLGAQQARLAALEEMRLAAPLPAPVLSSPDPSPWGAPAAAEPAPPRLWLSLAVLVLLIALLLGAHALIVGVFDLDTRMLRIVSILLPLPFGLLRPLPTRGAVFAALGVGVLAACGMLESSSLMFGDSFLPTDRHDWVEVAQYVACIAFAYFAGSLLGGRWQRLRRILPVGRSFAMALIHNGAPPKEGGAIGVVKHAHATAAWINSAMVVLSALGAIVTALSQLGHYLP